jgi:hypothetical protein
MIPPFDRPSGNLPAGIHGAKWTEFVQRFGGTMHRRLLLRGIKGALDLLRAAGCDRAYIDGSFTTKEVRPRDFDGCYEEANIDFSILDPVFDARRGTAGQKWRFRGEMYPANALVGAGPWSFLQFFQIDPDDGSPKGIVALNLAELP